MLSVEGNLEKEPQGRMPGPYIILSARSKAACGLTSKPKDPKVDIDAADADNELAVVEYLDEIYQFYKLTEDENRVHEYMATARNKSKMRSILVDWLIEVHKI
ncbi:hypothetical protein Pyn_04525 [Prunus yedoensis var. nudiflora]|uniref:B-like cyclin n=1 Tax=Prunus yedoensis var. nudiflora TaxID=2094558 RepID=A0A314YBM7_PRUYE|nr:hypothetical protein Pyn_04525 [Prunus yedoensis var. nudiflora]